MANKCPFCGEDNFMGVCVFCGYNIEEEKRLNGLTNDNSYTLNECRHDTHKENTSSSNYNLNKCGHDEEHHLNETRKEEYNPYDPENGVLNVKFDNVDNSSVNMNAAGSSIPYNSPVNNSMNPADQFVNNLGNSLGNSFAGGNENGKYIIALVFAFISPIIGIIIATLFSRTCDEKYAKKYNIARTIAIVMFVLEFIFPMFTGLLFEVFF